MKRWTFILVAVLTLSACGLAPACPMCKDSIANGEASTEQQAGSLPSGFNYSVYYMLSGLFVTMSLVGTTIYKGLRGTIVSQARGFDIKPPTDE